MSVTSTDQPERSAVSHSVDCHTARFTTIWPDDTVGIITVQGELDASNAVAFADHVDECAGTGSHLVLDSARSRSSEPPDSRRCTPSTSAAPMRRHDG